MLTWGFPLNLNNNPTKNHHILIFLLYLKFLLKNFNVKKIIAIDPTVVSKKLVKQFKSKKFFFENKALFIDKKKIKIFLPYENKKTNPNFSIENIYNSKNYIYIYPITIADIMQKYKIKKINILKLDVEGVADKIITDLICKKIYPDQILFELERPYSIYKQFNFFKNFIALIFLLKKKLLEFSLLGLEMKPRYFV